MIQCRNFKIDITLTPMDAGLSNIPVVSLILIKYNCDVQLTFNK